ncbi:helix-turn-helix domain-containing protein [Luteibacter aegosomatissinici]|uniref:helix-turn-helix domain-containing protein n=1 Tax=Luteibacter aegosomatissinici TaxID=2911539 RepID=UPI001FFBD690|nr:AraC family transcriptional regulator [Luteibacter aegosomatissinici]UPG92783.1 AraC family transcriptional regulator [Luteibacter aegosomatissinici]
MEIAELYVDGKAMGLKPQHAGFVRIVDMASQPFADIQTPAEFVQVNLPYRTLDELAYESGSPRIVRLMQALDTHDPVLHGLAVALKSHMSLYGGADQLFIDYVGLSFHAHVTSRYSSFCAPATPTRCLTPRQLKMATDRMMDGLAGTVSLVELAAECGMSQGYFARAFRHATGLPPHRWLTAERVRMAKKLLLGPMTIAGVALTCGFADQSHMTRVFAQFESLSPARWRRHFGTRA